jgi:hypothetical protein
MPGLSNQTFSSTRLSLHFDIPPPPDGVVSIQLTMLFFETFPITWPDATHGHIEFGLIKTANDFLCRTLFTSNRSWAGSVVGSFFVWWYDEKVCGGFVGSGQSTATVTFSYVGIPGTFSDIVGVQCLLMSYGSGTYLAK